MGVYAGKFPERAHRAWWLRALHVELLVAAGALATLAAGELVSVLESRGDAAGVQDHPVWVAVFDAAWVVFVPSFALALLGGVLALVVGAIARHDSLTRHGRRAVAFCALAAALVVLGQVVPV